MAIRRRSLLGHAVIIVTPAATTFAFVEIHSFFFSRLILRFFFFVGFAVFVAEICVG